MILAGDWAPGRKNVAFNIDIPARMLVNLEAPFLTSDKDFRAQPKAGPHLWTNRLPLQDGRFVFSLANNHMLDYGLEGLKSTTTQLASRSFQWLGAGENLAEAENPLILDCKGIRYGILARCELQFGSANSRRAGVAILNPEIFSAISRLKRDVDVVIVSVHSASEMSPWPSPKLQQLYRSFIDVGADVVHGHHSHIPQGYEYYEGGIIFYGMGNLCVDPVNWRKYPNALWSIVAEISRINGNLSAKIDTASIKQQGDEILVEIASEAQVQRHRVYLHNCNRPLAEPDFLTGLWQENAMRVYDLYYADWLGFRQPEFFLSVKSLLRQIKDTVFTGLRLGSVRLKDSASQYNLLLWYHLFACESHRDAISTALGLLGGELEDLRTEETRCLADEMMPWSQRVA